MHEAGHLELMTPDEYKVNKYAIGKYLKAGELNDQEFGRRIVVLSQVLGENGKSLMNNQGNLSNSDTTTDNQGSSIVATALSILPIFGSLVNKYASGK